MKWLQRRSVNTLRLKCCFTLLIIIKRMNQATSIDKMGIVHPFSIVFESLTSRERTILRLAAQDLTCEEIALQMGITKETVEKHRKNVLKKAGVKGKTALQRLLRQFELHFR